MPWSVMFPLDLEECDVAVVWVFKHVPCARFVDSLTICVSQGKCVVGVGHQWD